MRVVVKYILRGLIFAIGCAGGIFVFWLPIWLLPRLWGNPVIGFFLGPLWCCVSIVAGFIIYEVLWAYLYDLLPWAAPRRPSRLDDIYKM